VMAPAWLQAASGLSKRPWTPAATGSDWRHSGDEMQMIPGCGREAWCWELGILTMVPTCSEGRRPWRIGRATGVQRSASTTRTGLAK
jgi:hypothetical protein